MFWGHDATSSSTQSPMFQRVKMEAADSSETMVTIYQITWPRISKDSNFQTPPLQELKNSHVFAHLDRNFLFLNTHS
jgi:hypothetical protein